MLEIILSQQAGKVTADSRQIAEHFEKQHRHVTEAIESLIGQTSAEKSADLFIQSTYPDSYGRHQKNYQLTRDGFSLLVMGFTGSKALEWKLKYIEAFNRMEKQLSTAKIPTTFAEALRLAADQAELLEQQKPMVLFADAVSASNSTILVGDLAKLLNQNGVNIGGNRLFQWMRDNGYLIKRSGTDYNMPTQTSMDMGLFQIKETAITHADGHTQISKTTKVTGKGQQYFIGKFLKGKGDPS